jgi:hypothetical protein
MRTDVSGSAPKRRKRSSWVGPNTHEIDRTMPHDDDVETLHGKEGATTGVHSLGEMGRGFTLWVRWLVHHSRERTRLTLHQSAGLSCIDGALGGQRGLHTRKR